MRHESTLKCSFPVFSIRTQPGKPGKGNRSPEFVRRCAEPFKIAHIYKPEQMG